MDEKEKIKKNLKQLIKDNPESFPFIAQFWEIEVEDINTDEPKYLEFGKYNAKLLNSTSFYKPFSKIISLSKIEDK